MAVSAATAAVPVPTVASVVSANVKLEARRTSAKRYCWYSGFVVPDAKRTGLTGYRRSP